MSELEALLEEAIIDDLLDLEDKFMSAILFGIYEHQRHLKRLGKEYKSVTGIDITFDSILTEVNLRESMYQYTIEEVVNAFTNLLVAGDISSTIVQRKVMGIDMPIIHITHSNYRKELEDLIEAEIVESLD